jgi:hypothetical protein
VLETFYPLLLIAAVAFLAYRLFRARPRKIASGPPVRIDGPGTYSQVVIGTARHQPALETLAGGRRRQGVRLECLAEVVPEGGGWFSPGSARVEIRGQIVGCLSRRDAERFHKRMAAAGLAGRALVCNALVTGGGERSESQGGFSVRLDMAFS